MQNPAEVHTERRLSMPQGAAVLSRVPAVSVWVKSSEDEKDDVRKRPPRLARTKCPIHLRFSFLTENTAMISAGAGDCGHWAQGHPARNDISQPSLQPVGPFDQVLANVSSGQVRGFLVGP